MLQKYFYALKWSHQLLFLLGHINNSGNFLRPYKFNVLAYYIESKSKIEIENI